MKTSLIIGMGIGHLYATVMNTLGYNVITVDSNPAKEADFLTVDDAINEHKLFDTVHVCTPNFRHFDVARKLAPVSKIVFIEKPGVVSSGVWETLIKTFPNTRFMMVKNNMWRSNVAELKELANQAKQVNIRWIRRNGIPSPGSWFTTKELAYGGVSRDLMPHLLSLYVAMNPNWQKDTVTGETCMTRWELKDIDSTEYGVIDPDGTYDVDDVCFINFEQKWTCAADWRSMTQDDSSVEFIMQDNTAERVELGWCPEQAYLNMITDAVDNVNNNEFWQNQFNIDLWIHQRIENL
jgi:predicted dehydrogenase